MSTIDARFGEMESLAAAGRWGDVVKACAEVEAMVESDPRFHLLYGTALIHCDRYGEARDQLAVALQYQPESLDALNNLAGAYLKLGDPFSAEAISRTLVARAPDYLPGWNNLGLSLNHQGRIPEGIEVLQTAYSLSPEDPIVIDNLLLNLNYISTDGQDLATVHRLLCEGFPSGPRKPLPDAKGRRIRVGYVSSDFRSHPVSFFMAGVIGSHDRDAFEVFCYSSTHAPDARTNDFMQLVEHFTNIAETSGLDAAACIEGDQVDILVDLGGHTFGNRLDIFAHRPAPVQASYLGYPATTGCSFIDYRLVDALTDPQGSDAFSTERLIRLPAPFLCYDPHPAPPELEAPPCHLNGYITYGSFNNSAKISEDALDLWARVLAEVPDSHLLLKARDFSSKAVCDVYRDRFRQRGIDADRIDFLGHLKNANEHLAAYGRVDVALDTFPYNGTTTTCEALWMGVPVISLVGNLHAARVGCTLLNAVGLGGLAAASPEDYLSLAVTFPEDAHRLGVLRSRLRQVVAKSPLCDRIRFTRNLEDAFRAMLVPV